MANVHLHLEQVRLLVLVLYFHLAVQLTKIRWLVKAEVMLAIGVLVQIQVVILTHV